MVTRPEVIAVFARGGISEAADHANEERTQTMLDEMNVPTFGRVNIPIRDRQKLGTYAELLKGLANELIALQQAEHLNDYEAIRDAAWKCKGLTKHMLAISKTPVGYGRK